MKKLLITLIAALLINSICNAATFRSAQNGYWAVASTWTLISGTDADGIPDADNSNFANNDTIIIQGGHTVTLGLNATTSASCYTRKITIDAGGFLAGAGRTLSLFGDFNNSGSVTGLINFNVFAITSITSSSTLTLQGFNTYRPVAVSLTAGTPMTVNPASATVFNIAYGATFNNSGNLSVGALNNSSANVPTFNNLSGGILTQAFNQVKTFTFTSSANSTINLTKQVSTLPNWSYCNLNLSGSVSTKTAANDVVATGNLSIAAGVTLNLNSKNLTLGGNLANSGTISNPAAVTFNGTSAAQTIPFVQNLAFTDVTSNNAFGVSITSGTHTITNSLTVSSGNLDIGSNVITLVSDATKTAYIGNSGGTISGSMIVQRYVDARPTNWHDFSSTVASTTIDDWDNETFMSIGAPDDTPDYPGGDGSAGGDFSVFTWNPTTDGWDVTYAGTTLDVGKGYTIWLGDDVATWPGRAIDTRGTPNMGTVSIPTTYNAASTYPGWNLVGNPHAAFIEWNDVVTASSLVDPTIEMFDNSGNYQSYTAPIEIPAGQGLYAYIGDGGSLQVPQSAKRTTTTSSFNRMAPKRNYDLKLRLSSNVNPFYHEIKVVYDNKSSAKFEKGKDAPFIKSPKQRAPSVTFVDGDSRSIRNLINTESETLNLPLEINARVEGNYTLELEGLLSSDGYSSAYILNNLTKEKFELNDAAFVSLYLESDKTYNEFSLVLTKKKSENNGSIAESAENVSIFATSENINIKGNLEKAQEVKVEVYNIMGQLITEKTEVLSPNSTILLSTSELNSEVYVIKVTTNDNRQFTNRIVVAK